jgi:hypothetical protein
MHIFIVLAEQLKSTLGTTRVPSRRLNPAISHDNRPSTYDKVSNTHGRGFVGMLNLCARLLVDPLNWPTTCSWQ